MELIFEKESYAICGAFFEVYQEKGSGFYEDVYQECLEIEFGIQNIPHLIQPNLDLEYKGRPLSKKYTPDFICHDNIVIEIKAVKYLEDSHRAQVHNYLKATGLNLAFLVNFGHHPKIQIERIVR